jgi:hypothetical protein
MILRRIEIEQATDKGSNDRAGKLNEERSEIQTI